MATGTNHVKLGLFVLFGIGLTLSMMVILGATSFNDESVRYVSYFDESVQGLEIGSAVKFRGVPVGRVSAIDIAPDQRHVQVTSELTVPVLQRLNLSSSGENALLTHRDLRAQLAQMGLTGGKFVLIDYFDPADYPEPPLPFTPPANHIPAAASTMKGIEASVMKTADRFPQIADDVRETLMHLNTVLLSAEQAKLPEQAGEALTQATATMTALNAQLAALDAAGLSKAVTRSLGAFDATTVRVAKLMDRLEREDGVVASAERSFALIGELARGSGTIGPELELTIREMRGAARSVRRFADALERDPDMLVKGRAEP